MSNIREIIQVGAGITTFQSIKRRSLEITFVLGILPELTKLLFNKNRFPSKELLIKVFGLRMSHPLVYKIDNIPVIKSEDECVSHTYTFSQGLSPDSLGLIYDVYKLSRPQEVNRLLRLFVGKHLL